MNPKISRRRKEARPGEIAAAALELFVEKGFAATRLDDVAARAGVSKGTVYLYFENKEALFKSAVETAMMPAIEAAEALAGESERPAAELLRCFVMGWWQMIGANTIGGLPKLLVAEAGNFPELAKWFYESIMLRAKRAMGRIIELGIRRGEFRPVEPELAARVVFGPMFSYILWHRAFKTFMYDLPSPEIYLGEAVSLLTHGLVDPAAAKDAMP